MASLMSVNNNDDIAHIEDLEDEDYSLSEGAMKNSIQEVTQHLQQLTNSLSGSDFASTPISGKLTFFRVFEKFTYQLILSEHDNITILTYF